MKINTSELKGRALAYAVGVAEGCRVETWHTKSVAILFPGAPRAVPWNPHSDWSQGGPIIEREWLQVTPWPDTTEENCRWACVQYDLPKPVIARGPTPLIAAMRCFVASRLGDEVEIPEELL